MYSISCRRCKTLIPLDRKIETKKSGLTNFSYICYTDYLIPDNIRDIIITNKSHFIKFDDEDWKEIKKEKKSCLKIMFKFIHNFIL
jgi:hypothetical protein